MSSANGTTAIPIVLTEPTQEEIDTYLDEDTIVEGGTYAVISMCTNKTRQRIQDAGKMALKIRGGGFYSPEEAMQHVKKLQAEKDAFDCYVIDMYKWVLLGNIAEGMNTEHHMVDMMKAYHKRISQHKKEFDERKEIVKEEGLEADPHAEQTHGTQATGDQQQGQQQQDPTLAHGASWTDIDKVVVPQCNYVIMSVIERDPELQTMETPEGCFAVKLRGVFNYKEEAEKALEKLSKMDTDVDMYIADCYRWLMLPVEKDAIKDVRYREEYLQEMFSSYKTSQEEAKQFMRQAERDELTKKLEQAVHPVEIQSIEESDKGKEIIDLTDS
jgi:antitoxin component of RelBE/YafQ-DinJ toxin-antitoxin module